MNSVLVIDNHPVVLQGCRRVLEDAEIDDIREANNLVTGYRVYRRHGPQVIILDLAMQNGRLDGWALVSKIRSRDVKTAILVFSMNNDPLVVAQALEVGATGYLLKDASPAELTKALEVVRSGKRYLARDFAVEVGLSHHRKHPLYALTSREL